MKPLILGLFVGLAFQNASANTSWIGDFSVHSERSTSRQCGGKVLSVNEYTYSDWDLSRAIITNLCFEVYIAGVTDQGDSNPANLDVWINAPYKFPARFIERHGNNWVYAVNLLDLTPRHGGASSSGNTSKKIVIRGYARSTLVSFTPAESGPFTIRFE